MSPGLSENGFIVTMCPVIPEKKRPQGEGHQWALQGGGQTDPFHTGSPPQLRGACLFLPANAPRCLHRAGASPPASPARGQRP